MRLAAAALLAGAALAPGGAATVAVPPAQADIPAASPRATAVLAGGCFWGVEAVFERLAGVVSVESGYAGGAAGDARYDIVSAQRSRHAEAVRIVYDPRRISYATLLRVFFAVAHDPTQIDRQGPDVGPSYRSAIFPADAAQARVARAYIAQLGAARVFARPIATRIETGRFYPAEAYHQDFMARHPDHPYIRAHDVPKLRALARTFPALLSR
ncbi:peptide-methionine (S)-S-oxide reductase MsrA [Sphingomonas changnyeongensis]|uniref:Peptide methionine sulfoxide reductase MsrA n=1 Tax=Sphingomonas changnyeongensis TaxID=2698679 RepID=A0A7Z2NU37_9SPHN|nr:peptide-methionine (S)-S-oxide reductase MsrA [Sphingomonas changnyeongensis]QHL89707.1 peptide-methionine (S)-S-oxide reductase MsrA [Sphingomonas changnyeongensis]